MCIRDIQALLTHRFVRCIGPPGNDTRVGGETGVDYLWVGKSHGAEVLAEEHRRERCEVFCKMLSFGTIVLNGKKDALWKGFG